MVIEEWRHVRGYEGLYEVSSMGRVRALDRRRWISGPRQSGHYRSYRAHPMRLGRVQGYACVRLRGEHGADKHLIHVLVLEAFVGPRPHGMQVRHLNGVGTDNRLQNLAWGTVRENANDRRVHGTMLMGGRHPNAKLTADAVIAIRSAAQCHVRALCQALGISRSTASSIRRRKIWASVD